MPAPNADRVQEIFAEALQQPTTDRAAYLAQACGGDNALRTQVESLLGALEEAGEFMKEPTKVGGTHAHDVTVAQVPSERVGEQIGNYKLLQQIGEGGFGVVYMAEQERPVRRKVALKIIKLGMDTKQVIARFEAERQALAMMDHPNIAKVLDAGATDTGRPYFVMELVEGEAVTSYCDRANLGTRDRLRLFIDTCQAVQHAHQKGIIHRDIKPSNVLVTMQDGVPVPKVIDFGIAKATDQRLSEQTVFTQYGQFIGTPEYMSPEQAGMTDLDIDTRSDVYSLGVLLYELLTGTTPFSSASLRRAGLAEIQRIIREEEPPRPSTRISALASMRLMPASSEAVTVAQSPDDPPSDVDTGGASLDDIARQRQMDPRTLSRFLRGDLDWIIMKALEKDRTRRYETATAFADDVERYLSNQPVAASPPSRSYRMRKFIRRNKAGVTAAGLVAAALVLGIAGTTSGMVWALDEKQRADEAADFAREEAKRAESEKDRANDANDLAQRELARATEVKRIVMSMLSGINPESARDLDTTLLRMILDQTAMQIATGLTSDPVIEAEVRHIIGDTYWRIGLLDDAAEHTPAALALRRESLGPTHPDTLNSLASVGGLQMIAAEYSEAEQTLRQCIDLLDEAGLSDHVLAISTRVNLANVFRNQSRLDEAIDMYEEALALVPAVSERMPWLFPMQEYGIRQMLGMCYFIMQDHAKAETYLVGLLEEYRELIGSDHPNTLDLLHNLGLLREAQNRLAEATTLLTEAFEGKQRILGEDHQDTYNTMQVLGGVLAKSGRTQQAVDMLKVAVEGKRRTVGPEHLSTLLAATTLGQAYMQLGRFADARDVMEQTLDTHRRVMGTTHPGSMQMTYSLAMAYLRLSEYDKAEPLILEFVELCEQEYGVDHGQTVRAEMTLASLYFATKQWDNGEAAYVALIAKQERLFGANNMSTLGSMTNLGQMLVLAERPADAVPWLETSLERKKRTLGEQHQWTALAREWLARAYLDSNRLDEAVAIYDILIPRWHREVANPDVLPERLNNLADILLRDELETHADAAQALTYAQRACETAKRNADPQVVSYLLTLAKAQHKNGDTQAAIASLNHAIEMAKEADDLDEHRALLAEYREMLD